MSRLGTMAPVEAGAGTLDRGVAVHASDSTAGGSNARHSGQASEAGCSSMNSLGPSSYLVNYSY